MTRAYCIGRPSAFGDGPCAIFKAPVDRATTNQAVCKFLEDLRRGTIEHRTAQNADGHWVVIELPPLRRWPEVAEDLAAGRTPSNSLVQSVQEDLQVWADEKPLIDAALKLCDWVNIAWLGSLPLIEGGTAQVTARWLGGVCSSDAALAAYVGSNKEIGRSALHAVGLPIPPGRPVASRQEALSIACQLGFPVTIKTLSGSNSIGVVPAIQTQQQLEAAFRRLQRQFHLDNYLVEKHLIGIYHRILLVDGEILRVSTGTPQKVLGNGVDPIRVLCKLSRKGNLVTANQRFRIESVLLAQGYSLNSILAIGESARVSTDTSNWVDFTSNVNPETVVKLRSLGDWLGRSVLGVDIIAEDLSRLLRQGVDGVLEINPAPGWWFHSCVDEIAHALVTRSLSVTV